MADRRTIKFNGKDYDLVSVADFTIDEALILWDYAKMGPDGVAELEGFHPGVIAAVIHISVARGEPRVSAKELRREVGKTPMSDLEEVFENISVEVDDEAVTPPSAPGGASESEETERSSGEGSSLTGAKPLAVVEGNGSGSPGLDIGAGSVPVTSETATGRGAV